MPIRELEAIRALARSVARRASRALLTPTGRALFHGFGATAGSSGVGASARHLTQRPRSATSSAMSELAVR
jgi:hypothetical protein